MGESSAKHLRGESMADVVFSGSATRKPVQQASVELVFDNSDGRIGGQYAAYAEISIRRVVNREGVSTYSLNGTRCRRADITQIFLGTGAGARSYAVIEQGMISRIVEARPDDLRAFIEEAAGISKYKARRHETENRIANTRDNLQRVTDLRDELGRQTARLAEQARAAEIHRSLTAEQSVLQSRLLAVRARLLRATLAEALRQCERAAAGAVDAGQQEQAAARRLADTREARERLQAAASEAQQQNFAAAAAVARAEQDLQHLRDRRARIESGRQQLGQEQARATERLTADRAALAEHAASLAALSPRLDEARTRAEALQQGLTGTEAAAGESARAWETHLRVAAELVRHERVELTRLQQLDARLAEAAERLATLGRTRQALEAQSAAARPEDIEARLQEIATALSAAQQAAEARRTALDEARTRQRECSQQLAEVRGGIQHRRGQLASLEGTQVQALGKQAGNVREWLRQRGEPRGLRLAETLEVAAGWEQAVEAALGSRLELLWLEREGDNVAELDLPAGVVGVLTAAPAASAAAAAPDCLAARVRGAPLVLEWLAAITVVEDTPAALTRLAEAAALPAVLTRAGVWVGRGWTWQPLVRAGQQAGVLVRERDLRGLRAGIEELEVLAVGHTEALGVAQSRVESLQREEREAEPTLRRLREDQARLASEAAAMRARLEQIQQRLEAEYAAEREIEGGRARILEEREAVAVRLAECQRALPDMETERERLQAERMGLERAVQEGRQAAREAREIVHRLELESTRATQLVNAERAAIERGETALAEAVLRANSLREELAQLQAPETALLATREDALQTRFLAEQAAQEARNRVAAADHALTEAEAAHAEALTLARAAQQRLEGTRLDERTASVRLADLEQEATELGVELSAAEAAVTGEETEGALREQLERIARRIARLGNINLAAIDEHREALTRKTFLDAQHADLTAALETLETAIRTIDRETRARFQTTLERVDAGFQRLFPRLFGGGSASLRLLGDNLLDAGIGVTAQPPGKRNGTIHLLSGGEKALTAIALIFAIFELNPAPFCLLDEVDAPLDDPNVLRLCELLK
ncbi:MAG TPA: chromosome segregation protein SMC, partial [Gammaproteobacteria bacterium]|nr:chromosome segregation protein SMC [Gammaproteobacteria bacterium]